MKLLPELPGSTCNAAYINPTANTSVYAINTQRLKNENNNKLNTHKLRCHKNKSKGLHMHNLPTIS